MPPKDNIQLGEGTLYFKTEEGLEPLGEISEAVELEFAEDAEPAVKIPTDTEVKLVSPFSDIVSKMINCYIAGIIANCPNRRVAHLITHSKKPRTALKNWHRALKLTEREASV